MKAVYCYEHFTTKSQDQELVPEAREQARHNADLLFPRYQAELAHAKGTLLAMLYQQQADKIRSGGERLTMIEYFMLDESCTRLAQEDSSSSR